MEENSKVPLWAIGVTVSLFIALVVVWMPVTLVLTGGLQSSPLSLGQAPIYDDPNKPDEITVTKTGSSYKIVSQKPPGWFKSGQNADLLLSGYGFNYTGGALSFNHLGIPGSDGKRLAVPDRFNNRILIWNKLPTGNIPPDLVLGQKDFNTNNSGTGMDQLNWPVSVSVAPDGKVAVADTMNFRILIWNSFPVENGQPADIVLSGRDGSPTHNKEIVWPWGVWTDGQKLAVTSTRGSAVLIWQSFPTKNDQLADIYLTAKDKFGTPRTITSDGKRLIVSDHNAKLPPDKEPPPGQIPKQGGGLVQDSATFFWNNWPTVSDTPYDFWKPGWLQGDMTTDGKLLLIGTAGPFDTLQIWNSFPNDKEDRPDIGDHEDRSVKPIQFDTGDGVGIRVIDGKVYMALYNGNKIAVYNSIPKSADQEPDFVIGAKDFKTNTLKENFLITNSQVATDGKSLFAVSGFDRKLYVWKNLPDETGAKPDFVYDFFGARGNINFQASSIAIYKNTLAIVGRAAGEVQTVYIWDKLPLNGELPTRQFKGSINQINLQKVTGVAIDEKYFYLSDEAAGKVYVWEGLPDSSSEPKITLTIKEPAAISSDGRNLLVNTMGLQAGVHLYSVNNLSQNATPQRGIGMVASSGSAYIFQGHLFTTLTDISQVRVWKNAEDAMSGKNADLVLGEDNFDDKKAEIGRNKLFWPNSVAFDGSYLWVGEVKFSNRLLRFSVE